MKKLQINHLLSLIICLLLIFSRANEALAQSSLYNEQEQGDTYPFIWSDPDSPYLTEFRVKYALDEKVAGCESDYEKAQAVVSWVSSLWKHHGSNIPQKSDPLSILEEVEGGKRFRCVEYSIVAAGALNALGIPARTVGLRTKYVETELWGAGHVVAEAYLKDLGKWIMIDGQWGVIPILNGTPLSAFELGQALMNQATGLDVYSDYGVDKESFFNWIEPYLYYIVVSFDNRIGLEPEEYAGGVLMFVPERAIRPERFQIKPMNEHVIYTYYAHELYPVLTPAIYENVEEKKAAIQQLFQNRRIDPQNDYLIDEIIIEGLDRTREEIVRKQLPFTVGGRWTKEKQRLAEQRLIQMSIFNPLTVKVRAEKIIEERVRVFVSTEDLHPFTVHPVKSRFISKPIKVAIFKGIDLLDKELSYRIINPWGNGLSISAGVDWGPDPGWNIGLDYAGANGKIYSWEYMDFARNNEYFNQTSYQTKGFKTSLALNYIPTAYWEWGLYLTYQENDFLVGQSNLEQTYLSVATDVKWKKDQDLNLSLAYGKSLSKAEPDFGQVELALTKELGFNNDRLIINLGGGLASKETPLNYQFKGGGNSRIPLRGHKYNLAGTRYLSGNAEFHKFLGSFWYYGWYDLWGFVFIDCARFSQAWINVWRKEKK